MRTWESSRRKATTRRHLRRAKRKGAKLRGHVAYQAPFTDGWLPALLYELDDPKTGPRYWLESPSLYGLVTGHEDGWTQGMFVGAYSITFDEAIVLRVCREYGLKDIQPALPW